MTETKNQQLFRGAYFVWKFVLCALDTATALHKNFCKRLDRQVFFKNASGPRAFEMPGNLFFCRRA